MTALEVQREFSTADLCRLSGCSYRQADHWARTGALPPSLKESTGSGDYRVYSADDVRVASAFRALSEAGFGNAWRAGMDSFAEVAVHVRAFGLSSVLALAGGLVWVNLDAIADPFVDADAIAL